MAFATYCGAVNAIDSSMFAAVLCTATTRLDRTRVLERMALPVSPSSSSRSGSSQQLESPPASTFCSVFAYGCGSSSAAFAAWSALTRRRASAACPSPASRPAISGGFRLMAFATYCGAVNTIDSSMFAAVLCAATTRLDRTRVLERMALWVSPSSSSRSAHLNSSNRLRLRRSAPSSPTAAVRHQQPLRLGLR